MPHFWNEFGSRHKVLIYLQPYTLSWLRMKENSSFVLISSCSVPVCNVISSSAPYLCNLNSFWSLATLHSTIPLYCISLSCSRQIRVGGIFRDLCEIHGVLWGLARRRGFLRHSGGSHKLSALLSLAPHLLIAESAWSMLEEQRGLMYATAHGRG